MDIILQRSTSESLKPPKPSKSPRWKQTGDTNFDAYLTNFRYSAPWKVENPPSNSKPRCLDAPLPAETESLILRFKPDQELPAGRCEYVDNELINFTGTGWTEFPISMLGPQKAAVESRNLLEEVLKDLDWYAKTAMQVSISNFILVLIEEPWICYSYTRAS